MGLFDFFKKKEEIVNNIESNNVSQESQNIQTNFEYGDGGAELIIEDIFTLSGRGTVVTGVVSKGTFLLGDNVKILESGITASIVGIEMFRKLLDHAVAGDNVGLLIGNVDRDSIQRGQRIIK